MSRIFILNSSKHSFIATKRMNYYLKHSKSLNMDNGGK